jgi:hypothetical protein
MAIRPVVRQPVAEGRAPVEHHTAAALGAGAPSSLRVLQRVTGSLVLDTRLPAFSGRRIKPSAKTIQVINRTVGTRRQLLDDWLRRRARGFQHIANVIETPDIGRANKDSAIEQERRH